MNPHRQASLYRLNIIPVISDQVNFSIPDKWEGASSLDAPSLADFLVQVEDIQAGAVEDGVGESFSRRHLPDLPLRQEGMQVVQELVLGA